MRVLWREVRGRKKHPNWTGIIKEAEKALDNTVKPRLLEYPRKIVADWDHEVTFQARKRVTREYVSVYVYPTGPNKDIWVSRGTGLWGPKHKEYPIEPVNAPMLVFPSIYEPHTKPQGPGYGGPGKSSGSTVFAMHVDHPGIKPRHFEEAWGRWAKTWFRREMENAMRRGARKA
jgi:hypothetical protein